MATNTIRRWGQRMTDAEATAADVPEPLFRICARYGWEVTSPSHWGSVYVGGWDPQAQAWVVYRTSAIRGHRGWGRWYPTKEDVLSFRDWFQRETSSDRAR